MIAKHDPKWPEQLAVVNGLRARIKAGDIAAVWVDLSGPARIAIALHPPNDPRVQVPITWAQAVRLANGEPVASVLAPPKAPRLEKPAGQQKPRVSWIERREEYSARSAAA